MSDETTRARLERVDAILRELSAHALSVGTAEAQRSLANALASAEEMEKNTRVHVAQKAETVARLEQEHREQRVTQVVAAMMEHSKRVDAIKVEHAKEISDREAQVAALTAERDEWRNARHAFEADVFAALHGALDYPDDVTVLDMAPMLVADRDALRAERDALAAENAMLLGLAAAAPDGDVTP